MFEDFRLTQNVAACRWDLLQADEYVCAAEYDIMMNATSNNPSPSNIFLFQEENGACNVKNTRIQSYCYTYGMLSDKVLHS